MSSPYRNRSTKKPSTSGKSRASSAPAPSEKTVTEKTEGYEREFRHPSGAAWNRVKANVISYHNGLCGLCDHPGSLQVDHVVPFAETQDNSIGNLLPVHGVAKNQNNRCPVCNLACNNIRGSLSFQAGRAKVQRRMKAQDTVTPAVKKPVRDIGREW